MIKSSLKNVLNSINRLLESTNQKDFNMGYQGFMNFAKEEQKIITTKENGMQQKKTLVKLLKKN